MILKLKHAQGHNTVTLVRLEPAAPRCQDKHSTTDFPDFEIKTCDPSKICDWMKDSLSQEWVKAIA